MNEEVIVLIAEDDEGHANLIKKNLARAGIANKILCFKNGREVVDFLFREGTGPNRESERAYILLLDIRMPVMDGVEVLARLKADPELRKMPVTMITTTDDPKEIERCHSLGCSSYIVKPIEYDAFVNAIRQLGLYLAVVKVPKVNGGK